MKKGIRLTKNDVDTTIKECVIDSLRILHESYTVSKILMESQESKSISTVKHFPTQDLMNVLIFSHGIAKVKRNEKYNYIDTDGRYLSKQWFDKCGDFTNDLAPVEINHKWYLIDKQGHLYDGDYGQPIDDIHESIIKLTESDLHQIIYEVCDNIIKQTNPKELPQWNTVLMNGIDNFQPYIEQYGTVNNTEDLWNGQCQRTAYIITKYTDFLQCGGKILYMNDFIPDKGEVIPLDFHVFLWCNGKYYDASVPNGVNNIADLPLIKQTLDIDDAIYNGYDTLEDFCKDATIQISLDDIKNNCVIW